MNKSTHFIGQPMYGQLLNLLDKQKILRISREKGGERYVKRFDAWRHLVIMLYAVIKRFDSLREISDSTTITLFSNLLLMVIQKRIKRTWSFSGLATMVRIMLMYYVNCYTFLESPERDWTTLQEKAKESPPELTLF